tara:strand:- start:888 stop:1340 length:453 start_codon:yes stop_codon:yes gene_type:complete
MAITERNGKFYRADGKEVSKAFADGRFKKGEVANPNGRPKKRTLSEELRDLLSQEQKPGMTNMQALAIVILKQAKKGRFPFIQEIFNRMEGKVADKTQISGTDGKPLFETMDLSDAKRRTNFYELLSGSVASINDGGIGPSRLRGDGVEN